MMRAGPEDIAHGVARLNAGGLVAFPTETVYGLGADAFNADAVAHVFERKGRPPANPLIVHVSDGAMARTVVAQWSDRAQALADAFWPGPMTLVLPKGDAVPLIVTGHGPTVGVRCPDHPLTLALIEAFGHPIVGPSANPSGAVSPTIAGHVRDAWPDDGEDPDLGVFVIDGGPCRAGIESTVVDLCGAVAAVLRPGVIGTDAIAHVLGEEVLGVDALGVGVQAAGHASGPEYTQERSPGRLGAHYQPGAPVHLYTTIDELGGMLDSVEGAAVVLSPPGVPVSVDPPHSAVSMPAAAALYGAELYARLREPTRNNRP
jgi:L-threonylcarbamoyladenylate synthase